MSGRSKQLSLDRYLWLATRGLPRRVRLDTAAELRVHLLERIRALEGQGFPRGEAEHVAVSEMGLPEGTNRAFLGHFFTFRVGWVMLGLAAVSAGVWWGKDNVFPRETGVQSLPLTARELSAIVSSPNFRQMQNFSSFRVVMPPGAVGLARTMFHEKVGKFEEFTPTPIAGQKYENNQKTVPANYRHELTLVVGTRDNSPSCRGGTEVMTLTLTDDFIGGNTSQTVGPTCFTPSDGYGANTREFSTYAPTNGKALSKLELNKSFIVWGAKIGPDVRDCYGINGYKTTLTCKRRLKIGEETSWKNPSKHWDRQILFAIRPVSTYSKWTKGRPYALAQLGYDLDASEGHTGFYVDNESQP